VRLGIVSALSSSIVLGTVRACRYGERGAVDLHGSDLLRTHRLRDDAADRDLAETVLRGGRAVDLHEMYGSEAERLLVTWFTPAEPLSSAPGRRSPSQASCRPAP
jgi:hypothetical protein